MPSEIDYLKIIEYFYPQDTPLRKLLLLHSTRVCNKALSIAGKTKIKVDLDVVRNGAMLHDIGIKACRAPSIFCEGDADYMAHGIIGSEMLRRYAQANHLDLDIYAAICEHHTGSGITAGEVAAQGLPIPVKDYLPITNEEKLITLADKFFSKSGDQQEKPLFQVRRSLGKFGEASLARFDELCRFFGVENDD